MTMMKNISKMLSALFIGLILGCQTVPSDSTTSANETGADVDETSSKTVNKEVERSAKSVRAKTWQLVQMNGYDAQQSTYQTFTLSFEDNIASAKAFNVFNLTIDEMADNGVIRYSGEGATTRMGVPNPEKAELERTYFNRVQSASLWRVLRRKLIIGSGEKKLVFISKD